MTNTISKTFWVSDAGLSMINTHNPSGYQSPELSSVMTVSKHHKITITWEAPEKVIRLSESDYDRIMGEVDFSSGNSTYAIKQLIKSKLFKDY